MLVPEKVSLHAVWWRYSDSQFHFCTESSRGPLIRHISRGASGRAHRGLCHRDRSLRLASTSLTLALHLLFVFVLTLMKLALEDRLA